MKPPTMPRARQARFQHRQRVNITPRELAHLRKAARRSNAMYWLFVIGPLLVFAAMLALAMAPLFMK
jgi:hypothetical protein